MIAVGPEQVEGFPVTTRISRREALGRVATGLGIASVLQVETGSLSAAQRATPAARCRRR